MFTQAQRALPSSTAAVSSHSKQFMFPEVLVDVQQQWTLKIQQDSENKQRKVFVLNQIVSGNSKYAGGREYEATSNYGQNSPSLSF